MFKLGSIISSFFVKLGELAGTVQGWIIMVTCMLMNIFVNYQLAFVGVITCIFIDMFMGIWSAIKQEKYARSELMRDTFSKIVAYCGALFMLVFMEHLFDMDSNLLVNICAALICATELWSIAGNALIINPRLLFFRVLKPALIGEIARKLHMSEDEVKAAFDEDKSLVDKKKGKGKKKNKEKEETEED